jgi:hypothetical protein
MELSKLQIIALVILTTILTDKFLINHSQAPSVSNISPTPSLSQIQSLTPAPVSSSSATSTQTEIILRELINLRKDLAASLEQSAKEQATTNTAPDPTLSASLLNGMVKINSSQWEKLDVYEKPLTSSKIINSIVYDTIYFYAQKQNGWYQLNLDGGQLGWVQSQFLKEFP